LKFDKAGTCNFYGNQDTSITHMYSLTVTNGTTVESYCRNNDFHVNVSGTLVNSGTLNSNRNWSYKSQNMPIVGASSDLRLASHIFYYAGTGIVSGAATTYHTLRPAGAADVYMQGDFDATTIFPQDTSVLHFNGYKGIGREIVNYGGGDIVMEAGSALSFTATDGFETSHGSNVTPTFIASGEAAVQFFQDGGQNWIDIPNGDAIDFGDDAFTITYWTQWRSPYEVSVAEQYNVTNMNWPTDYGPGYRFGMKTDGGTNIDVNAQIWAAGFGTETRGNENLSAGTWHHVAIVCSGASNEDKTLYFYVNGSLTKTAAAACSGSMTNDKDMRIGGSYIGTSQNFIGSMADVRIYKSALSAANATTLSAINPTTDVSGNYADPDNDLTSTVWIKMGATASGTMDLTNYGTGGSAYNGTMQSNSSPTREAKSGFVTISGTAGFNSINRIYPAGVTLQNTYMSGSADIVVGQIYRQGTGLMAHAGQTFTTKGTVVLD
jgi:hypothetical protein